MKSIYKTIKDRDYLGNIAKVIEKAEQEETLNQKKELTLFCPNDSAFGVYTTSLRFKLDDVTNYETNPIGQIEDILKTKETAYSTLKDHLILKKISTKELSQMNMIVNENNKDVAIVMSGDQVLVGNATIIIPDIECSNGIIHIINIILTPAY